MTDLGSPQDAILHSFSLINLFLAKSSFAKKSTKAKQSLRMTGALTGLR